MTFSNAFEKRFLKVPSERPALAALPKKRFLRVTFRSAFEKRFLKEPFESAFLSEFFLKPTAALFSKSAFFYVLLKLMFGVVSYATLLE